MELLSQFFSPETASLKICGVTDLADAAQLVAHGVPALGLNFWPKSKRYCSPDLARELAPAIKNQIARVGVFVNHDISEIQELFAEGLIDVAQLHGDESEADLRLLLSLEIPTVRSLVLPAPDELASCIKHCQDLAAQSSAPFALLLDAHAPGLYGGTGETIDWTRAAEFIAQAHPLPVLLAGGITPDNAARALAITRPAGLDIASGAELSPGRKDLAKVAALQTAVANFHDPAR